MQRVTAQFLKKPDILHWGFETFRLGEDEHGVWLGILQGGRRWKGGEDRSPVGSNATLLVPRSEWWTLHFGGSGSRYSHFVDITTPPVWVAEDRVEMVDLDLDVGVRQDGSVFVEDEDEFAVHQVEYGYTGEEIRMARETTGRIVTALESRSEPFFEVAESWLGRIPVG